MWSALAIVFAESVSDFGVAATLANDAHFPVATYTLYNAVQAFPIEFPIAAAVGWILMGFVVLALIAQNRALRTRSYRVLGGRSRPARRLRLSPAAKLSGVGCDGVRADRRHRRAGLRSGIGVADQWPRVVTHEPRADPLRTTDGF